MIDLKRYRIVAVIERGTLRKNIMQIRDADLVIEKLENGLGQVIKDRFGPCGEIICEDDMKQIQLDLSS